MSTIRPLPGIRYNTANKADISSKLAPPYDVLSDADKQALLDGDPQNFVKLDLPHTPPKAAGPAAVYAAARDELYDWLSDGVLVADETPALYVYHQKYTHGGREYLRKKFFARLRLEPFGQGGVFPHEQTFGGPKEDRLALTKATEANMSPIFGLYEDHENVVAKTLEAKLSPAPLAHGTLDGVESRMWAVTDEATISRVVELMRDKPVFIADGHHRYGTAMMYRDHVIQQHGNLPDDHPANFVLCVLCAMEDPGLLILPTHRVLAGQQLAADQLEANAEIDVAPLDVSSGAAAVQALAKFGPQAVGLYSSASGGYVALRPKRAGILDDLEPKHSPAWRRLGLAFLHAYLLDRVLAPLLGGGPLDIHYVKSDDGAVAEAEKTRGIAFLMQPTTMAEMRGVCQAGDLMPQKSTYFFPKLASGMVINPLTA